MLSIKRSALSVLALLFALNCVAQTRLYVAAAATGANDGSSWADAFTDLQSALQIAQAGDTVWVAAGTYKPSAGDRAVSFAQPSDVRLYGGFAGTETDLDQRDWEANATVLSGDIGVVGDSTDNSYNVVYMPYPDSATVLDGFVIRHGTADYSGPTTSTDRRKCGAGLYVMAEDGDAYPIIRNCRFEHNTARLSGGGALVNATGEGSAAPYFFNCVFSDNAASNGGGLARLGGSWVEQPADLDSCAFLRNRADNRGGGFYYSDSERSDQLDVSGCRFEENTATTSGGGTFAFLGRENGARFYLHGILFQENQSQEGAALTLFTSLTTAYVESGNISECVFTKNLTNGNAAPLISIVALSITGIENTLILLTKNSFAENTLRGYIAAISPSYGTVFANDLMFYNNLPISSTNTITCFFSACEFVNIERFIFYKNIYVNYVIGGGGNMNVYVNNCYISDNEFFPNQGRYHGYGIDSDSLTWTNCLIANNINATANHGRPKHITIKNCSFSGVPANNGPGENSFWESTVNTYVSHSHLSDLTCADLPFPVTCGPGILTGIDPLFVAPDSGDYRLQPCSPLVNAGDNAGLDTQMTDLAGQPRIQSDIVDIGAYETPPPQLAAAPGVTPGCPGGFSGAVTFQPEQGCPPFEYAWALGADTGQGITQLTPGSYVFTVTDARGSYFTAEVTVPDTSLLALLPQATPVPCGDTLGGSAAVVVQNALPPLTYDWQTGATDSLLTGLPAGLYAVTASDAQGCTAVGTVEVGLDGALDIVIEVMPITCPGAADGAFMVQPANGQAPFAWQWAGGPAGPTHGPLGPGLYAGTLTDAFGCSIGWLLPLDDPQAIVFDTALTHASGPSAADGSAAVTGIAGGQSPFHVVWSNGDTGFVADSLLPGLYGVTVTDANGCEESLEFEISFASVAGEPGVESSMLVFPNPTAGWFTVRLPERLADSSPRLVVSDVLGRVMLARTLTGPDTLIDARDWPEGVYALRLAGPGRTQNTSRAMRIVVGR